MLLVHYYLSILDSQCHWFTSFFLHRKTPSIYVHTNISSKDTQVSVCLLRAEILYYVRNIISEVVIQVLKHSSVTFIVALLLMLKAAILYGTGFTICWMQIKTNELYFVANWRTGRLNTNEFERVLICAFNRIRFSLYLSFPFCLLAVWSIIPTVEVYVHCFFNVVILCCYKRRPFGISKTLSVYRS